MATVRLAPATPPIRARTPALRLVPEPEPESSVRWPRFVTDAIDLARVVWAGVAKLPDGRRPASALLSVVGLAAMDLIASRRRAYTRVL